MKSKSKKYIIILCALVFAFSSSPITVLNSLFNIQNSNIPVNEFLEIDSSINDLRISGDSDIIIIDNNWTAAKAVGICTGNGTYTEPYIIKDVIISSFYGTGISIKNSNEYFRIDNCTIHNSTGALAYAITLQNTQNGIITNNNLSNVRNGIDLLNSDNVTITSNIINNAASIGIYLDQSNHNNISGNAINGSGQYGISMVDCEYNTLSGNLLNGCSFYLDASLWNGNWTKYLNNIIHHEIDSTNLVNGKPLYYYKNKVNLNSDDFLNAGQVILANCNDSIISNLNISHTSKAITFYLCNGITLTNNTASYNSYGIHLIHSENNLISENFLNRNCYFSVSLQSSNNNQILKNNAISNNIIGAITRAIFLSSSLSNVISGNSAINYTNGIELKYSSKNVVSVNNLKQCSNGIQLFESSNNEISRNTLNKSYNGILLLYGSSNNVVSENNIINYDHTGIYLYRNSDYNTVSGNTLTGNGSCINEINCKGNIFWANGGCIYGYPINLIIFLSTLIAAIVLCAFLYRIIIKRLESRNSPHKPLSTTR